MNYRHIYHAGNFADVLKHAVLVRLVEYLKSKDKAFRIIDTHAGSGLYDLSADEARRTGEHQTGIERLASARLQPEAARLLAPYLDIVRSLNMDGAIYTYPGSPKLVRMLMRRQDRLSAIELHPDDATSLQSLFEGDHQTRVIRLDGWLALGAHVPPKEKRGVVLVDPPFEQAGEFDRMVDGLARAIRRWRSGTYCLWYPLKKNAGTAAFHQKLTALGIGKILCVEAWVRSLDTKTGLNGSGMVIVNPPYTLPGEMDVLLPALTEILRQDSRAGHRHFWIVEENAASQH